jgi:hypothetical protein
MSPTSLRPATAARGPWSALRFLASPFLAVAVLAAGRAAHPAVALTGSARLDTFASTLPVLVLDNDGGGELTDDRAYHAASLEVFTPGPGGTTVLTGAPALSVPVQVRVRGNSSAKLFPKKSYNFELQDAAGRDTPLPLLGLDPAADWALVSPWNYDRAFIRNACVYRLSRILGRWAPRTRFVELFFNTGGGPLDAGDYLGLSVLTDRIKLAPDRLDLTALSPKDNTAPAVTGAYLLKIDELRATDWGFITDHGIPDRDSCYVVVDTPGADKLTDAQRAYIRDYVQQMENALFADRDAGWTHRTYLNYLDAPSWVDHHLLETFVGNVDAFAHSDYFYKDRGGKLVAGPVWDFDRSLGSYDERTAPPETWSAGPVDVWSYGWYGVLARDPEFQQAWIDRWQALRRAEFATPSLQALADALAAEVTPEAAARDAARWPDNASPTGSFAGEIARIKDWLARRAAWIDAQFVAPPLLTTDGATLTVTPPPGARLAYTLNGVDPRGPGGQLGLSAQVTAAALTVPAGALLVVRAWHPAVNDFPATPWSAPLTAADATRAHPGALPAARLSNLSSLVRTASAEAAPITGFVLTGPGTRRMLVRAVGPTLAAFGVAQPLADPVFILRRADGTELARAAGLDDDPLLPQLSAAAGAFALPASGNDAATIVRLPAGAYTLQLASASGQAGTALAEIYDLENTGGVASLAVRAALGPAQRTLIGGFTVQGSEAKTLLVRAVGPGLTALGVPGALADPVLELHSGLTLLAQNDDWPFANAQAVAAAAVASGAFTLPAGSKDAALLVTLAPGSYTAQVAAKAGAAGIVLLEVYAVP